MALRPIAGLTDNEVEELFLGVEAADPSLSAAAEALSKPLERLIANLHARRDAGHFTSQRPSARQ